VFASVLAVHAPGMVVNPPSDGGAGARAGVEAVEASKVTLAADSLLLSVAERFLSFILSLIEDWAFCCGMHVALSRDVADQAFIG
jgi:hypothetical protein